GVTALAFLPALGGRFIDWDDGSLLLRNPWYRGLGPSNLAWMVSTVRMGHWMPLNWISFGLDYVVWDMNPLGYHLTNVLLHAGPAPPRPPRCTWWRSACFARPSPVGRRQRGGYAEVRSSPLWPSVFIHSAWSRWRGSPSGGMSSRVSSIC